MNMQRVITKEEHRPNAVDIVIRDMHKKDKNYIPAMGFDFLTPFYDTLMKVALPEEMLKNALLEEADILPGQRILDFGCGTATLTIMGKQKYPEAAFVGLDVDENILRIARKKISQKGLDISIDIYDGFKLPYEDNYFDRVISSFVFHHLSTDRKKEMLRQMYRILKADGMLHILDFGNPQTRIAKWVMRLFNLFEPVDDNVKGLIPEYTKNAGFADVSKVRDFRELWGTFSLYSGCKGCFEK